jgi:bifunctional non-homologous end joining protein LigD
MLALLVAKLPEGPGWIYEVKLDGYRIEAIKHGGEVRLLSRRDSDYTKKFSAVTEAVAKLKVSSAHLDGEVVAVDESGRPSFQVLQNRGSLPTGYKLVFYAFDLLALDGKDLKQLPLIQRRTALAKLINNSGVLFSASLPGRAAAVIKIVQQHGLEGVVAKRKDSLYEPGQRSGAWQKLPLKPKGEFFIGGYRPTANSLEVLLVGHFEKGKFIFAGKVHQGLNPWNRSTILKSISKLHIPRCPFSNLPNRRKKGRWNDGITAEEMKEFIWVKPEVLAEIKFTEWTAGGVLRYAEFVALE